MKYYKGFDKDLKCRGFQYEIGGEYDGNTHLIKSICAAIVDGEEIKPDIWYTVKDGKFVEVADAG